MKKYITLNKCIHKWKYIGIYDGGYYNHKECIYCNKLEIEKSNKYEKINRASKRSFS